MTHPSLSDLESLARAAGKILRDGYEKDHDIQFKGVIDLVTEIDHQSEAFLLGEIKRRWPELGNEGPASCGSQVLNWVIETERMIRPS